MDYGSAQRIFETLKALADRAGIPYNANGTVFENNLSLNSSLETGSGVVPAGKKSVMFTCTTGTEIVNGVQRVENQVIVFEYALNATPEISWDANGGSLQIDILE